MSTGRKRRSFGSRVPVAVEGLELELNDGHIFKVRPQMSGLRLLNVIAEMEGDDEGAAARAMIEFLRSCFLLEDRDKAMEYLEDSDPPIDLDDLRDIVQWLIGEYTGNSTDPSQSSSSGSDSGGSTTTEEPSVTASTSLNSMDEPSPL